MIIQLVALALPAVALFMQYSLTHIKRIEDQYEEGKIIHGPGRRKIRRTEKDIERQQLSGFLFTASLIPLSISGILFLLHLLLYSLANPIIPNTLQLFIISTAVISIIIFFIIIILAVVYSAGGMIITAVNLLVFDLESEQSQLSDPEQSQLSDFEQSKLSYFFNRE